MNSEFFKKNRKRTLEAMEDNSILVLFAGNAPKKSADESYQFTPNRNFYYLTGIDREAMILMMVKTKNKTEEVLFIEKSDEVMAKWIGEKMSSEEAKALSGIESTEYIEGFEGRLNRILFRDGLENIYLDLERNSWDAPLTREQSFAKTAAEKYPYLKIRNIYNDICSLRVIKTEEEIETMKKAIEITKEGIYNMMKNAKPGMMEYQLEAYFNFTLKSGGIRDFAFPTIAASGKNGTVLHYSSNNSKTEDKDLILFDLGAQYKYYNADISRTFPLNGKFTERQKELYNIVLKAQLETIKTVKPGVHYRELNEKTKKVLAEECMRIGLIKEESELFKYYYHSVTHFLGLDTHDVGSMDVKLVPGMVLTMEPGLYVEEEGIGIRIEDDVLVTEDGCEVLSKDIIKTVEDIEKFMSR